MREYKGRGGWERATPTNSKYWLMVEREVGIESKLTLVEAGQDKTYIQDSFCTQFIIMKYYHLFFIYFN